jgi:hypothetical protein
LRLPALLLLLAAACSTTQSPFVRVTHETGRIYYARMETALHSPGGGFLTFRDLVTRETVKLKDGTYLAQECPASELDIRQREYLEDPSRVPHVPPSAMQK